MDKKIWTGYIRNMVLPPRNFADPTSAWGIIVMNEDRAEVERVCKKHCCRLFDEYKIV